MRLGGLCLLAGLLVSCGSKPAPAPDPTPPPATPTPATPATPTPSSVRLEPTSALPEGTREAATKTLVAVVAREAGDPKNAWALAHGLLAEGREFVATDGRRARDVLASDFLEEGPSFPTKKGAVRVEPHEDLILKSLIESGIRLNEPIGADAPTVRALLEHSHGAFAPVHEEGRDSIFPVGNDAPWSVQSWCQAAKAGAPTTWTSAGKTVQLDTVAGSLFALLEKETYPIRVALTERRPVQKNKQAIFRYTCGGAHLFQGVEACLAAGFPNTDTAKPRFSILADLYLYRLAGETAMVDAALQQYPQLAILLINQDIKFLGHLLESLGKAERDGLWSPNPAQIQLLEQAEARLLQDVAQLTKLGAYGQAEMAQLAGNDETFQMYLDLVGDAAHALNGLRIQAGLRGR